jgi:NhaA family Na+:H+ antiporter
MLAAARLAAALGGGLLRRRHLHYERVYDDENRDDDHDGVPDVYQRPLAGQTGGDDRPARPTTEGSP